MTKVGLEQSAVRRPRARGDTPALSSGFREWITDRDGLGVRDAIFGNFPRLKKLGGCEFLFFLLARLASKMCCSVRQ